MLYSVYCKEVIDDGDDGKDRIDYYDLPLHDWVLVDNGLTIDQVLDKFFEYDMYDGDILYVDFVFVVLPEIEVNDKVFNTKSNQVGTVIEINDNNIKLYEIVESSNYYYQDVFVNDLLFEFVTVECNGEILNWKLRDLIVVNMP